MQIDIPKRLNPNLKHYGREDYEIARRFSHDLEKEMGSLLSATVLFGSAARKAATVKSDVDVLVIIDDISTVITRDVSDGYRMVAQRIIASISRRLHIVTLRLTAFWDYIRVADPIGINILRDGVPILDRGFFEPLQMLLRKGRIRPTKESIWAYYVKAPATLNNSKWHIMQGVIDLYWAVIDAAHAALMSQNVVPPTPEHVADLMDEVLVKKGFLEKKYSKTMRDFYDRAKQILHREVHEIKGADYDRYLVEANAFIERMKRFIPQ